MNIAFFRHTKNFNKNTRYGNIYKCKTLSGSAHNHDLSILQSYIFCMYCTFGVILTVGNFIKYGMIVVDWCYMCKCSGETMDHLLQHCTIAMASTFMLFGAKWIVPISIQELLQCWRRKPESFRFGVWTIVPMCFTWTLWKERTFEGGDLSVMWIKSMSISSLI